MDQNTNAQIIIVLLALGLILAMSWIARNEVKKRERRMREIRKSPCRGPNVG